MQISSENIAVAKDLSKEIKASQKGSKCLKLRTLLKKFDYIKRSDANTGMITSALGDQGVSINPPIVRFGDDWGLTTEDWIYLTDTSRSGIQPVQPEKPNLDKPWQNDPWFDKIIAMDLRTEKEVEIKFIVPILEKLGYTDDDRFDGMPVPAAHGSKQTTLVIDFALFNGALESLRHQPLLIVEAKHESRLQKRQEILAAHNQAKSYCLWTQCDFFMVTDGRTIELYHIARGNLKELSPLFSCERHEIKARFGELHELASKSVLTQKYLSKFGTVEEAI